MTASELINIIQGGENSGIQFRSEIQSEERIAQDLVAMADAWGGYIFFGVRGGQIIGLAPESIKTLGLQLLRITDGMERPVYFMTEVVRVAGENKTMHVLVVSVAKRH
jgi:predicted HTH transcriptional regulator